MVARRRVAILRRRARVHGRRTGVGRLRRRRATLLHRARVGQRAAARRLPDLHGDEAILDVADHVRALGRQYAIREFLYDPWRAGQLAQELEREGVVCVQFNQNDQRMAPASERLYNAIVDERLTLPDDPELARHASNATAKHSRRGWRISKPDDRTHIDGVVALAMAVERAEFTPEPVELLGWL
jgi:phage terminase large subunit-like protein